MADRYTSFQARQQMDYLLPRFLRRYPEYAPRPPAAKGLCRLAWIDNGTEGWGCWRPIAGYDSLKDTARCLGLANPGVKAWVETR